MKLVLLKTEKKRKKNKAWDYKELNKWYRG